MKKNDDDLAARVYTGQIRQGDVLIEPCNASLINGLTETPPTAARGEKTGHHHSFHGKHSTGFYKEGAEDHVMAGGTPLAEFIRISDKPDALRHQEHGPIPQAPGVRRAVQQVEYSRAVIVPVVD